MTHSMGQMGHGFDPIINCPRCHIPMQKTPDRNAPGVTIDMCPNCRGTWFDDGELPIVFNAVASQGKFRTRPQSFFTSAQPHQQYGVAHGHTRQRHHRGSSDSIFDGFFGGSS